MNELSEEGDVDNFGIKVKDTDDGVSINIKVMDNESMSIKYGFKRNIIGLEFDVPSKGTLKVEGFYPRNSKYSLKVVNIDNKISYKAPAEFVKNHAGGDSGINRQMNLKKLTD